MDVIRCSGRMRAGRVPSVLPKCQTWRCRVEFLRITLFGKGIDIIGNAIMRAVSLDDIYAGKYKAICG